MAIYSYSITVNKKHMKNVTLAQFSFNECTAVIKSILPNYVKLTQVFGFSSAFRLFKAPTYASSTFLIC